MNNVCHTIQSQYQMLDYNLVTVGDMIINFSLLTPRTGIVIKKVQHMLTLNGPVIYIKYFDHDGKLEDVFEMHHCMICAFTSVAY